MDTRKSSFRLLSLLIPVTVFWWATACSPATPTPWPTATPTPTPLPTVTPIACERNNTDVRREEVMKKYNDLLWRQPNVYDVFWNASLRREDNGRRIPGRVRVGILVVVYPKVDQSMLPPEDRIPDCLEGIPVQVIERSPEGMKKEDMMEYLKEKWPCAEDFDPPLEQRRAVRDKYSDMLWRQPNVHGIGVGTLRHENGEPIRGTAGIKVYVTEKTDQSTLPPEDRIPDCLEGIPVQVLEEPVQWIL